jgi:CheY-like chemotaxis protein
MEYLDYYLPTLMRTGVLNIRKIAIDNPALSAEEYLKRFAKLTEEFPQILAELDKISKSKPGEKLASRLNEIKEQLDSIAFNIFTAKFGENPALFAKEIAIRLNSFHTRIANIKPLPKSLVGDQGPYHPKYIGLLNQRLSVLLTWLDGMETLRRMNVMIVDDAAIVLRNITAFLGDKYNIYALTNPVVVDMYLDYMYPELIILDYKMPEISGFDLISIIRAREEYRDTPIIILTATATNEAFMTAVKLGACDFIAKPFTSELLHSKVAKHIVRKQMY